MKGARKLWMDSEIWGDCEKYHLKMPYVPIGDTFILKHRRPTGHSEPQTPIPRHQWWERTWSSAHKTPSSYKWKEPWPSRSLTSPDHSRRHRQMECLFPKAFPAETCSLLLWGHDLFTGISLWARRGGPQPWTQEEELNSQPRNLRVTSRSLLQNHLFSSLPQCLNFHSRLSVPWVTAQKTAVKM